MYDQGPKTMPPYASELGQCGQSAVNPSISGTADACLENAQRIGFRLIELNARLECKPTPGIGSDKPCGRPQMGIITTLSQANQILMAIEKEICELERRIFG